MGIWFGRQQGGLSPAFVPRRNHLTRPASGFVPKCHQSVDRTPDAIAFCDVHDGVFRATVWNDQFRRRTELYHSETCGPRQAIAGLQWTDDSTCDRTRHLPDSDWGAVFARHHDEIGFVDLGGFLGAGIQMVAWSVSQFLNRAVAGGAIDVDIENAEKDSDHHCRTADGFMVVEMFDRRDVTICRADQILLKHAFGSSPERVPEEQQQRDPCQENDRCDPPRSDPECNHTQNGAYDRGAEPFSKSVE